MTCACLFARLSLLGDSWIAQSELTLTRFSLHFALNSGTCSFLFTWTLKCDSQLFLHFHKYLPSAQTMCRDQRSRILFCLLSVRGLSLRWRDVSMVLKCTAPGDAKDKPQAEELKWKSIEEILYQTEQTAVWCLWWEAFTAVLVII